MLSNFGMQPTEAARPRRHSSFPRFKVSQAAGAGDLAR